MLTLTTRSRLSTFRLTVTDGAIYVAVKVGAWYKTGTVPLSGLEPCL